MKQKQEQPDMLDGKYGKGTAYAMKIQVAIGECFDAKRMVPITRAHVALSNQEADLWFCEKLLSEGAHCRVAPTVNPGFCYDFFTKKDMVDPKFADLMQRTHNAYKGIGAQLTYNCTPYIDTNVPMYKEVIAFSESSATPYVNSVWGARSNREGANSALCAAVTGFVPEYGLLLDENRKGNILVEVQADMKTAYDYHILGMLGKKIGEGIPVFTGLPGETITKEALRNLGAELNTSGAYGMYHILGVTPEAPDMETAFGGKEPERKVVITNDDMAEILKEISLEGNRPIDFVMFGCPHFTLEETGKRDVDIDLQPGKRDGGAYGIRRDYHGSGRLHRTGFLSGPAVLAPPERQNRRDGVTKVRILSAEKRNPFRYPRSGYLYRCSINRGGKVR